MRAIQTRYAGCFFRSRLEARWAVFFDALKLSWEYEPEGFVLKDESFYLPDFYLHDFDAWVEIKPPVQSQDVFGSSYSNATEDEKTRCKQLAQESGKLVYMFFGCEPLEYRQIRDFHEDDFGGEVKGSNLYFLPDGSHESCAAFAWSEQKRRYSLGPFGQALQAKPYRNGSFWANPDDDDMPDTHAPQILQAYAKARSARFEHGQAP